MREPTRELDRAPSTGVAVWPHSRGALWKGLLAMGLTLGGGAWAQGEDDAPVHIECVPDSPWCKTFYFGVQFLPDYDEEDGTFDGIGAQSFFAHFNFDLLRLNRAADHAGFDIRFLRSGAIEESTASDSPPDARPRSFDTVAGTVDLSTYYTFGLESLQQHYPPLGEGAPRSGSALGLKLVVGGRTREGSLRNEDTLSAYGALGLHYRYFERFPLVERDDDRIRAIQNRAPTGEFDLGLGHFEEWGGRTQALSTKDLRVLMRGVYNLGGIYYVGIYANGGRGPDEVSVFFGAKKSIVDLLDFLGLG